MKKTVVVLVIISFFFAIALAVNIHAQNEAPGMDELPLQEEAEAIQAGQEKYEQFTTAENKSDYLKKEWGKILSNSPFMGPIIRGLDKISPVTDPLFKYTVGMEPSMTWLFILTLIIWIALAILIFRLSSLALPFSSSTRYVIAIGGIIFISIFGAVKKFAEGIIAVLSIFNAWYMQLIAALLVIVAIIIGAMFSKQIEKIAKRMKEQKEKEELETGVETLKAKEKIREEIEKESGM